MFFLYIYICIILYIFLISGHGILEMPKFSVILFYSGILWSTVEIWCMNMNMVIISVSCMYQSNMVLQSDPITVPLKSPLVILDTIWYNKAPKEKQNIN